MATENTITLCVANNVDLTPYISSFSHKYADLDVNTSRNTKGTMIRNRIAVKNTVSLQFADLTSRETPKIYSAMSAPSFSVTFQSPVTGGLVTKQMYVSDRTNPIGVIKNNVIHWIGLSFELVEV
jgi:hypothetical protein